MQSLLPRVTLHLNHHFKALVLRPSTNKRFSQVNCAKALAMHEAGAATCCSSGALQPADDAPSTSGRTLPITSRVRSPPASPTHPAKRRRIHTVTAAAASQQPAKPAATGKKAAPAAAELQDDSSMWMIVGLGNPGANYERTRHNIGFLVVDALASAEGVDCRKLEKSAAVGRGLIEGKQVILVKPVTFMNNSGEAVSALARFYKIPMSKILVISDDLDMPHAALRLRAKGGHGGHNGLRSIIERMGNSQEFPRLKIGIGRPAGQLPTASWVLQDFNKKEMEVMEVAIQQSCDIVRSVLKLGLDKALSQQMPKKEEKPKAAPQATAAPKQGLAAARSASAGAVNGTAGGSRAASPAVVTAPAVHAK